MAATHTLNLHLSDDVLARVQNAVDNGDYASAEDVVQDALRGWTELRSLDADESLREICQSAIEDGRPGVAAEPVFARLTDRFRANIDNAKSEQR